MEVHHAKFYDMSQVTSQKIDRRCITKGGHVACSGER